MADLGSEMVSMETQHVETRELRIAKDAFRSVLAFLRKADLQSYSALKNCQVVRATPNGFLFIEPPADALPSGAVSSLARWCAGPGSLVGVLEIVVGDQQFESKSKKGATKK